jgi:tetratricopeptide (TPR) repeat protein
MGSKRLLATVLMGLLLALAAAVGVPARAGGPRERPLEILSMRHEILTSERYRELADQWADYVQDYPLDARAWVEWGDALRYSGRREEAGQRYTRAFEIDSSSAVIVAAYVANELSASQDAPAKWNRLRRQLERAAQRDPGCTDLYYLLWIASLTADDQARADESLRRLVARGEIARPLLDYAYNMLAGAPQGAIIFTNGDNDTYPPLAVQVVLDERPDVTIVNISLLNTSRYVRYLRCRGLPITLDDTAINALTPRENDLITDQMQRHIFDNLARAGWPRPLYYAITVPETSRKLPGPMLLEGLLCRVPPGAPGVPGAPAAAGGCELDLARTCDLLERVYRLDSMTDPFFDWRRENAIAKLGLNYTTLLSQVGLRLVEEGRPEEARPLLLRAIKLAAFHNQREAAEWVIRAWERSDPGAPQLEEARRLTRGN